MADDLVMPYDWWSRGSTNHTRLLHLHGMGAIGGSVRLLLGAAGFAILSYGKLSAKPGTKPGKEPYTNLAAILIAFGSLFFLGVTLLTHWFIQ
ncbi:hypothetical protein [Mesorhizobium loti]|uniref:hypothetical protein n=1 Tax=Rhizobium loti TaxID=381 RepID=UPI00047C38AE|nr:hypothetical protein [Mesorhizobium loti]